MESVRTARRLGWLLQVNRRLGPLEALHSGRTFARVFRSDRAHPLAPSQVTRWESGRLAAGRTTIRRYEQLLGLPAESLVTVADAIMRSAGNATSLRDSPGGDPDRARQRLYHLLDRVTGAGPMTGPEWSALTELTIARPHLELYPPTLWHDIAGRLLEELVGAAGSEWLQRQEAMSRLIKHPAAGTHAIAACIAMANDTSSPAVVEPLSLLDATADTDANRYVLRQIAQPDNPRAVQGALRAAIRKVGRGHFTPAELGPLAASIGRLMGDCAFDDTLLPLVVEVARTLAQRPEHAGRLTRRIPAAAVARQVWTTRRVTDPAAAQAVSTRIAVNAQSRLPYHVGGVDTVLAALVEESLFLPDPDRNLVANMLIAATPYRPPFAHVLLDEIKADLAQRRGSCPLAAGLAALTQVGASIHRPVILEILTGTGFNPAVRHAAAWATPFCAGRYTERVWRQIFATQLAAWRQAAQPLGESILQAITYGIGTDGHARLLADIHDHPETPAAQRTMASWLLRTAGPSRH